MEHWHGNRPTAAEGIAAGGRGGSGCFSPASSRFSDRGGVGDGSPLVLQLLSPELGLAGLGRGSAVACLGGSSRQGRLPGSMAGRSGVRGAGVTMGSSRQLADVRHLAGPGGVHLAPFLAVRLGGPAADTKGGCAAASGGS